MDALAVTKDKFNAALQRGLLIISGFRIEPVETSACPLLQGDCFTPGDRERRAARRSADDRLARWRSGMPCSSLYSRPFSAEIAEIRG
jgi:hypothetical protein